MLPSLPAGVIGLVVSVDTTFSGSASLLSISVNVFRFAILKTHSVHLLLVFFSYLSLNNCSVCTRLSGG